MSISPSLQLRLSGVAPSLVRELSGVYPTFASAFKELVSNAYDADASMVRIRVARDLSSIEVQDDGTGMTPLEVYERYLRVGGSVHRESELTPGGRRAIGRKGIGFLAVARYCTRVELLTHATCSTTQCQEVLVDAVKGARHVVELAVAQSPLGEALAPFIVVRSVQCAGTTLPQDDYVVRDACLILTPAAWRRCAGRKLTIDYTVESSAVDSLATVDYDYLLGLDETHDLSRLPDFCKLALTAHAGEDRPFTRVTLHLRDFVRQELASPRKAGWVRNIASAGGLERFVWHLSRSAPMEYDFASRPKTLKALPLLAARMTPTAFKVEIADGKHAPRELWRPFLDEEACARLDQGEVVVQAVKVDRDDLKAQGYILGFRAPVFPAEMRGIAVRVRGVEIGRPSYLGAEHEVSAELRALLSQVTGEILVTEGLDAIEAITPGREGFYNESEQFQALRSSLVGDGPNGEGALTAVLRELQDRRRIEGAVGRMLEDGKRRREAFLAVARALTSLAVGSRYGRSLRRLFSRTDVKADGLRSMPKWGHGLLRLPSVDGISIEMADLGTESHHLDLGRRTLVVNRNNAAWDGSFYVLGRNFRVDLRDGGSDAPPCELDLGTDTVYLNWTHPTRGRLGDAMYIQSALYLRLAYLAGDGDVDLMMNLYLRALSHAK